MSLKLIKLTNEYKSGFFEMMEEWILDRQLNHTNDSPYAIFRNDYHDFDRYIADLDHDTTEPDWVADSVFFLLDTDRDRLLGAVNIRHCLNDFLIREGGHIGDGIRPSERRKGYGTEIVRLALEECRKLGIDRVLMVCGKDNVASAKTIIRNGGVLENEIIGEEGKLIQRFWIDL